MARTELEAERYPGGGVALPAGSGAGSIQRRRSFLLGLTLAKQERWADAERELERAIRLRPGDAAVHAELAGVHFKQDRRDRARASLNTALKLDPQNSYARSFLAILSYLQDRRLEALHHWNLLVSLTSPRLRLRLPEDAEPELVRVPLPIQRR